MILGYLSFLIVNFCCWILGYSDFPWGNVYFIFTRSRVIQSAVSTMNDFSKHVYITITNEKVISRFGQALCKSSKLS